MILDLPLLTMLLSPPDGRRRGRRPARHHRQSDSSDSKWIWAPGCDSPNTYIYARRAFDLEHKPVSAVIKIAADTGYRLFVNGAHAGQGILRGGRGEIAYDTFDVAAFLQQGRNAVCVLAHYLGENTYNYAVGVPGLICKLEIKSDDGGCLIVSDEAWKVRKAEDWASQGARISKGLGFQEVYDSGRRIENWPQAGFDDRDWTNAVVTAGPGDAAWRDPVPRQVPAMCERVVLPSAVTGVYNCPARESSLPIAEVPEMMAGSELTPLKKGRAQHPEALLAEAGQTVIRTPRGDVGVALILDFGRMVSGCVELCIAASGEGVIDIGYAELLQDGRVKPNRGDARYADRVLLKKGSFLWRSFAPRAFRYLQMEFRRCSKPVALDGIRVIAQEYPCRQAAEFNCSDSLLNKIWSAGVSTARLCMQDALVDSPRLERAQWSGDARIVSRMAYYAFGDTQLLAQCLRQFASAQSEDGWIPGLAPSGVERLVPDFALAWVFSLLDYLAFSSNPEPVRELFPSLKRLMEWFGRFTDGDGLLADVPGDPFIDWVEIENRGSLTSVNCLYYQALRAAAVLASVAGEDVEAENFLAAANTLKIAINKHLFCRRRGLYGFARIDGRLSDRFDVHSNILAVACDVADHYQKSAILRWAAGRPLEDIATPYFASFLLEALYAADRHEDALRYIKDRWGPMAVDDCATLWEDFAGEGGRCQGWAVSPAVDLLAEFVGIKPSIAPGRYSVAPHTGGLGWASGAVAAGQGRLSVAWRKSRSQFSIRTDVPKDIKVDVYLPCSAQARVMLNGRAYAGRLLTLGPGSHEIKVAEPSASKAGRIADGGKPALVPHVEVLGTAYRPGRRQAAVASSRRKGKHIGKAVKEAPVLEQADEPRETLETPLPEPAPEPPEDVQSGEDAGGTRRRRRPGSSRGGSRRRRTAKNPAETSQEGSNSQPESTSSPDDPPAA